MNTPSIRSGFLSRSLTLLCMVVSAAAGADPGPSLADAAIYSTVIVPANVAFDLSVEFPTAVSDAYYSTGTYSTGTEFVGYFNPNMCYDYVSNYNSGAFVHAPLFETLVGYFTPGAAASNHTCTNRWSGNFLNWILTQTIDPLRKTVTGGARIVDEGSGVTILQRAYQDSQSGSSNQQQKSISGSTVTGATPFKWSTLYVYSRNGGLNFAFGPNSMNGFPSTGTASYLNCSNTSGSGSSTGGSTSSSPYFSVTAQNALTLLPGCSGMINISAAFKTSGGSNYGNPSNTPLDLAVSGLPSGVTYSFTSSSISSNNGSVVLTLTAGSSVSSVAGSFTITGTKRGYAGNSNYQNSVTVTLSDPTAYLAQAAVQVCGTIDAPLDLETAGGRCRAYGSNYKPVGLMQKYAAENSAQNDAIRYAAFGYMLDTAGTGQNENLDGGVMRARMSYVGPYKASPGASAVANANSEWNATTGVFNSNSAPTDASNTPAVTFGGTANGPTNKAKNPIARSGVSNYLNLFGFVPTAQYSATTRAAYKRFDSVSELYYVATRYFRNLGNLVSHTSTATAITNGEATNDNFPVIENWDDPIQYTCSTNYIIGIGDIHTWDDENVPGATAKSSYEVAAYAPTDDSAVNAANATNYVAKLENLAADTGGISGRSGYYTAATGLGDSLIGNIASPSGGWGASQNSFYMAGLAFDVHVRDIRPDLKKKTAPVTVSTFWLDVMESNDYHQKNQFWLTAKYGGFDTTNTYLNSDGTTYSPFPINPSATSQVNPNNSGVGTGSSAAANTYAPSTPSITFPAGTGGASTSTKLPLSAWCGTAGQPCSVDDHGNYAPDQYYQAGSPSKMIAGLSKAFQKITATIPSGTASALALASNSVATSGNTNYVINYDYNYGGDIQAQQVTFTQTGGVISASGVTTLWDARSFLPPGTATGALTATTRLIATSSAQGAGNGVAFQLGNLSNTQKATLAATNTSATSYAQQNVLNYIRGDQCNETASGMTLSSACKTTTGNTTSLGYRSRGTVLGDIIDAQPVVVGLPNALYGDAPLNPGYSAFKSVMTKTDGTSARGTMLYIGANDGMMHAFDTSTGIERFAYVPSALLTANTDAKGNPVGLASLTVSPLQHHFMVDGQAVVADVDFNRSGISGGTGNANWGSAANLATDWRSVLIGGLGKGAGSSVTSGTCTPSGSASCKVGGGYYAIDVTNPSATTVSVPGTIPTSPTNSSALSGVTTESGLTSKVLWEINQSSADFAHMGYSYGMPMVIKTKTYGWTLVLTSGYGNDDGSGWIYLVNPKTGALLEKISLPNSSGASATNPAGLAQVTAFIPNVSDYTADALYAADLLGNVWRVDLTQSSMSITLLAKLTAPDGTPQAVTTYPYTGTDPTAGTRYVFVGTGKLLADTDLVLSQTQTFYAFQDGTSTGFDTTSSFPITRSMLVADNLTSGVGSSLAPGVRGFYVDLTPAQKDPNNPATQASAERITVQPVAFSGIVGFAANLQGQDMCVKGSARVFQLNYDSGYSSNGSLAGLGQSLILDSSGNVAPFVGYSIGLVTNLGFGTSTSGLTGSGTPIITMLIGLDMTAGGSKQTPTSTIAGLASVRAVAMQTRLNWREVQSGQ